MLNVNIHVIVFTTDIANKKKYVLSTDKDNIQFPCIEVNNANKTDINSAICEFIRQNYLFLSNTEILPQFVCLHSTNLSKDKQDSLDVVYGSIVPLECQKNDQDCFWLEFDILDENANEESYLLMNVIRSLI